MALSTLAEPPLSMEPFAFVPEPSNLEGPAFSLSFQVLVAVLVTGLGAWLIGLWVADKFGDHTQLESLRTAGWFILAWLLLVWTGWQVRNSRTRMNASGLDQTWIWHKHMPMDNLAYSQLIRIRGLEWLIAPRFYLRTLDGKFAVFYIADPSLQRECARLGQALQAFRQT